MKTCNSCGETKALEEFWSAGRGTEKRGRCAVCCRAERMVNRDARNASVREWYSNTGKEKAKVYRQKIKDADPVAWSLKNKDRALQKSYGITLEQREAMALIQNYCCVICATHEDLSSNKRLVVDHDHKKGYVRDLLCDTCNTGLGFFKDDIDLIRKAMEYLEKHKITEN